MKTDTPKDNVLKKVTTDTLIQFLEYVALCRAYQEVIIAKGTELQEAGAWDFREELEDLHRDLKKNKADRDQLCAEIIRRHSLAETSQRLAREGSEHLEAASRRIDTLDAELTKANARIAELEQERIGR